MAKREPEPLSVETLNQNVSARCHPSSTASGGWLAPVGGLRCPALAARLACRPPSPPHPRPAAAAPLVQAVKAEYAGELAGGRAGWAGRLPGLLPLPPPSVVAGRGGFLNQLPGRRQQGAAAAGGSSSSSRGAAQLARAQLAGLAAGVRLALRPRGFRRYLRRYRRHAPCAAAAGEPQFVSLCQSTHPLSLAPLPLLLCARRSARRHRHQERRLRPAAGGGQGRRPAL